MLTVNGPFLRTFTLLLLLNVLLHVRSETLTPPYFNLAEGKKITATATCGVDTEGPELYCKLIGANSDNDLSVNVIQGQYCDVCDPTRPDKMHPPEFAVDGMETWWQSPPLSRGMKYNEVNLTIDLGQEFHVAYVYIKMANSPRPGLWILEKSADYGQTYTPWQYFSDSPSDCETFFGRESLQPITRDDSIICSTEYSKIVPLEGGEIPISLLNKRPSANHYFNSTVLQEWTRATNVRLRFLRTKNLLGHLMSVARQDPTVTRRYFYSIKDISIGGRCMCNGHAPTCDIPDPKDNNILLCRCKHNTCGAKCDKCCPGFEQKAWRQSKHDHPFSCEPCNCFQHSNECVYDPEVDKKRLSLDIYGKYEGGGVCQNCQHNTEGINCNKCKPRYYRPYHKHLNESDVCQPCQCDHFYSTGNCAEGSGRCECRKEFTSPNCDSCSFGYYDYPYCKPCECFQNGTRNQQCSQSDGACNCLHNFSGQYCKSCAPGFYSFPECKRCECDLNGSENEICELESGNCTCKTNFAGRQCNECKDGYYQYPNCNYCNCDIKGTVEGICDKTNGKCLCKEGYGGERCDKCILGYYGYPDCQPCNCSKVGTHGTTCSASGKCSCLINYSGRTCDQCSPGYFDYPECKPCDCNSHGSNGVSCDAEGTCECHKNFAGQHCDVCKEGYYNFPACEDCNCHPAGVVAGFAGCGSVPAGELCQCKNRVEGRICNKCKPSYWNLNPLNPYGCEECHCNPAGVLGGIEVCDSDSGQCVCKPSVISRSCSECADGTYDLQESNLFGCVDCGCDVGGSINNKCDKKTGQCLCQNRVTGRTCKEPLPAHYFPTLYYYQYEVEDGRTPEYSRARYKHDENVFPNYSWKGYAVFSELQREVVQEISISKPSLYRMVLHFVNRNPHTVIGTIRITPDNTNDIEQWFKVQFRNSSKPVFVTVSGESGNVPSALVMNPGRWFVSINVNESVLIDYFVLLPEDFYLATILNQKVEKPCTVDHNDLCRHYAYPNISFYDRTNGVGGFIQDGKKIGSLKEYFQDTKHLNEINVLNRVPLLNVVQPQLTFNLTVSKPGSYVIVVNYVTPLTDQRTHKIGASVETKNGKEEGSLALYSCPYTTMCRQAITKQGAVAFYSTEQNNILLTLTSENANVGIHSIYTVPEHEWSLDIIQPKPVCIRKNNTCIPSKFHNPPETKKIQFEQDIEGEEAKNRPPIRVSNETSYIWLNPSENTVDLKGKVPYPGYFTFVLHYYQPDFPEYNLDVIIQNGQFYEAKVPVKHCPSLSGCRSVVLQADRNNKFSLTENFMITLKDSSNKNVYLDYLLVIPTDLYSDRNLEEEDLDRTGEFIATCASNHFNIDTSQEGFCKDSVFSISAGHHAGAIPCHCDSFGSLSFHCEKFGGQCQCKPNIIGRTCEACKTGYYGFPECKPCNCPSTAYCVPDTGECVCPSHVIGEACDQCEPLTYGYDSIIGCQECNCNVLGVLRSRQCDLLNGSCECKPNVRGRTCDSCTPGHFAFPDCQYCDCNPDGTTNEICDQQTAECFCKKNVVGPTCNFCRDGTYNLQANNEEGCTECFCFGKATRCFSSQLIKSSLRQMHDWEVLSVNITGDWSAVNSNVTVQYVEDNVGADFTSYNITSGPAYFSAPKEYLGKRLSSYGSYLNYTIFYVIGDQGSAVSGPDIILKGAGMYLSYTSLEQPPPSQEYSAGVQLVESNFEMPAGVPARREHIMSVLKDLQGIYIRATYWSVSFTTRLIHGIIEEGVEFHEYAGDRSNVVFASSVEQCQCPYGYEGLSCEECAPGFYRVKSGPHGGYCVPCECHGHANECDVNTGVCKGCNHNTRGDHCELCEEGYHGNALAGTPRDCLICACPLPTSSNNFAKSCDVSADGEKISCECKEGYFGARCQSCAPGFYGRPEIPGEYCKPCQCSGNIDTEDPGSCSTITGECLKCMNNTFGKACALCAPGYFGDAVTLKDCQSCICDELGTDHCDSLTGRCICKQGVEGEKCDRCKEEHYGFQSGQGCVACDCAEASESNQCVDATGQCKCKEGVAGRSCDRCAGGYWNYTSEGCVSCGCKSEYSLGFGCNANTGQCECLKGVIGEKCDQCPHRWAFVPDFGCHQCDSCTHALLDDTDALANLIDPIISEFDSTNSGYFTRRRLDNMRDTLEKLKPKFDDVDPHQISLEDHLQDLEGLEQDSTSLNRKSNYSLENSESLRKEADELKDVAAEVLNDLILADDDCSDAIDRIDQITFELNNDLGAEIDVAEKKGREILDNMKLYNLTGREEEAKKELEKVKGLLKNVTEFKQPVDDLESEVEEIRKEVKEFKAKLDDLYNNTQYSLNKASEAEKIIEKIGKDRLKSKLSTIEGQVEASKHNLDVSQRLLNNASELVSISIGKLKELQDWPNTLDTRINEFNATLENNLGEIAQIVDMLPGVQNHAQDLAYRAQELDNLLSETRNISYDAVKAGRAYQDIVDAVKNARDAANIAQNDTVIAVDILNNVTEKTYDADQDSSQSLDNAFKVKENTHKLQPMVNNSKERLKPVQSSHDKNERLLTEIQQILNNIHLVPLEHDYNNASINAEVASGHIDDVKSVFNSSFEKLPEEKALAQKLPKELDNTRRDIIQTKSLVESVRKDLPPLIEQVSALPEKQRELERKTNGIESNIKKLNQQIELARDIANRIKVGVKFYPNTTLELRNPANLEDHSTSIKFSGYFKTNNPYGLLMYLGNPNGTNLPKTKTDDYMALQIVNGYPVLKFDIGNGPDQLINDKYVADGIWYQFIVERIGDHAKLTIKEEGPDRTELSYVKEKRLEGPYSIFNLDKDKSKLFVGSFPINYDKQNEIEYNSFEGEMEDLVIGDSPVSLWNFNEGYENHHGSYGRDTLVDLQPSTGFRFNGNGFAVLDARSYFQRGKSDVSLMFKSFASEGLLFFAAKRKTFLALELRNGKVIYQYNLGSGTKRWVTSKAYNDGMWHKVSAIREGAKGRLIVDKEDVLDNTKPISGNQMEPLETVSFGGYPNKHDYNEVTNIKFDGCIDNVTIMGSPVDLRNNIKTYDVAPGCPEKFAPMVSFASDRPGYISWNRLAIDNDFKVSLKFKTKEKEGLIFYVTDVQQMAGISLALNDGKLKVISQKIELESSDSFNDGKWHVVSVMHNKKELRVDFDDFGKAVTDSPPPPLQLLYADMYVGGLPRRIVPVGGSVGSTRAFSGCIADLTVNGEVKNFANTTERSSEIIGSCILDKTLSVELPDVPQVIPLRPLEELEPTTAYPPVVTKGPLVDNATPRGDGGIDFAPVHTDKPITEDERKPEHPKPVYHPPPVTPKPPKEDSCALPLNPAPEDGSLGHRFGTQKFSRMEYKTLRGKHRKQYDFKVEVKTSESNGIVFYAANADHSHYVAILFVDGFVKYTFKGDKAPLSIMTNIRCNDDNWHSIVVSRELGSGKLVVDDVEVYGRSEDKYIELKSPFYVGGLHPDDYNYGILNLNMTETFKGCIRNFEMNGKPMENPSSYGIIPCSDNVEPGTFFFASGNNYIKLKEKFNVGAMFDIKLDIKPRKDTGLLVAVHGKRDYFVLEMINGRLNLTVENGRGPITASFSAKNRFYFCDGNWHSIQAVKSKNVITLSVDNVFTDPMIGNSNAKTADTGSALFLGGHKFLRRVRGIVSKTPYVGCIRNVSINDETVEILPKMVEGNVTVGSCRTN